jgi:flagellar biosynthesis/type III secretory pathway chaperone
VDHISHTLIEVLNEQIRCAEAMLATLGRENEALTQGDAVQLNAAGADKARLVETLEALEVERRTLSEAIGTSFAGEPAWATLLGLIAECKDRNRRNGALVKARSEQVRTALNVLRGGAEPECYDPTGMPGAVRGARRLGSA